MRVYDANRAVAGSLYDEIENYETVTPDRPGVPPLPPHATALPVSKKEERKRDKQKKPKQNKQKNLNRTVNLEVNFELNLELNPGL